MIGPPAEAGPLLRDDEWEKYNISKEYKDETRGANGGGVLEYPVTQE